MLKIGQIVPALQNQVELGKGGREERERWPEIERNRIMQKRGRERVLYRKAMR